MKIKIKVLTNTSKKELIKINEENYKAYLTCIPENQKANKELLLLLKKELKLKKVKILKGSRNKDKLIEIEK